MTDVNVVWNKEEITRNDRERQNGHRGCVIWMTGLSGSGKSTISNTLDYLLYQRGVHSYLLDGDNVRFGLNASEKMLVTRHNVEFAKRFGLGFTVQDREENIRRIGSVAKLFCEAGIVTIVAIISPYQRDREAVRSTLSPGDFIEVFINTPLEVCEMRDPKGLYKKARAGELSAFTGIDDPYEAPRNPEIVLEASQREPWLLAREIMSYIEQQEIIPRGSLEICPMKK